MFGYMIGVAVVPSLDLDDLARAFHLQEELIDAVALDAGGGLNLAGCHQVSGLRQRVYDLLPAVGAVDFSGITQQRPFAVSAKMIARSHSSTSRPRT